MTNRLLLSLISAFLVISCSLLGGPTLVTPTPQVSLEPVSSAVAATLTANPLVVPSQSTTTPTNTAAPATPTATGTPEPTNTPEVTSTPTILPTSDDITSSLGPPTWKTTFDDSSSFFQKGTNSYSDDHTSFTVANGVMTVSSFGSPNWVGWRLAYPTPKNFYLEAYFHTEECSGKDRYGLVFRAPDYESGNGYFFGFSCDGQYVLNTSTDSGISNSIPWSSSDLVLAGSGQNNRLGVWISGDSIKLYANGKLLQEVTNTALAEAGHFGVFIAYAETVNFTVEMDNIAYWNVP
jgi:hypothetical protein